MRQASYFERSGLANIVEIGDMKVSEPTVRQVEELTHMPFTTRTSSAVTTVTDVSNSKKATVCEELQLFRLMKEKQNAEKVEAYKQRTQALARKNDLLEGMLQKRQLGTEHKDRIFPSFLRHRLATFLRKKNILMRLNFLRKSLISVGMSIKPSSDVARRRLEEHRCLPLSKADLLSMIIEKDREFRRQIADLTDRGTTFISDQQPPFTIPKKNKKRTNKTQTQLPAEQTLQLSTTDSTPTTESEATPTMP
ncbi:hypothetical protein FQR65_LT18886 [Abscondita terminalis]|nr:hypothetical protein FQR65_LT18886 [Abscondita terminalis]